MKKKSYFKPDVKIHQFRPTAILAGSQKTMENNGTEDLGTEQNYQW